MKGGQGAAEDPEVGKMNVQEQSGGTRDVPNNIIVESRSAEGVNSEFRGVEAWGSRGANVHDP